MGSIAVWVVEGEGLLVLSENLAGQGLELELLVLELHYALERVLLILLDFL